MASGEAVGLVFHPSVNTNRAAPRSRVCSSLVQSVVTWAGEKNPNQGLTYMQVGELEGDF